MTRGKRPNSITLSGRAALRKTDEVEINGTQCAMIDALAAAGKITPPEHRSARYLIRDYGAKNERFVAALAAVAPKHQAPLTEILTRGVSLADYGKRIMGWRNRVDCETWALGMLRKALDDVGAVYRGRKRIGDKPFPGFGDSEDEG